MASPRAPKRTLSDDNDDDDRVFFTSSPIIDRSSTFVAHFHPHIPTTGAATTVSSTSLTSIIKSFQAHPDFASADHRMAAWRRPSGQRTLMMGASPTTATPAGSTATTPLMPSRVIYTTGSDDDGEKYAGKRLERVLQDLDVEGVVIVARWYGGIMLGPVRFTHIENVAKQAITKWKQQAQQDKRQKMLLGDNNTALANNNNTATAAEEAEQRARLAKQLVERDSSIVVLRGLLAEKTTPVAKAKVVEQGTSSQTGVKASTTSDPSQQGPSSTSTESDQKLSSTQQQQQPLSSPSAAKIDYTKLPLQRLLQLDKARDATIAFILKQLDKADEDEKQQQQQRPNTTTISTEEDGCGVEQQSHDQHVKEDIEVQGAAETAGDLAHDDDVMVEQVPQDYDTTKKHAKGRESAIESAQE